MNNTLYNQANKLKADAEFYEQTGDKASALAKYNAAYNCMNRFAQTQLKDADNEFIASTYHNLGKLAMYARKFGVAQRMLKRGFDKAETAALKAEIESVLDSLPETEEVKSFGMNSWYECKVKYEKVSQTSGKTEKVTEPYLLDAVTFSEAEERIYKVLEEKISGEFAVKSIAKANVTDVFEYESGEWWFKCKVRYVDVDEESGKEKKVNNYMLVTADDTREAYDRIQESLKEMVVPFEVPSVSESPIIDVFPYSADETTKHLAGKVFDGLGYDSITVEHKDSNGKTKELLELYNKEEPI